MVKLNRLASEKMQSRFRGCLFGLALGDALGAPFEGSASVSREHILAVAEKKQLLRYTDDTHMALGVAESLVACRGFDGRHMAETFARNYAEEPWRGYGPGAARVLQQIIAGTPWDRVAKEIFPGGSFGNGAAMRVAPVGLFYCGRWEKVKEIAILQSKITHTNPLGMEGAALQALAVALAAGPVVSKDEFLSHLQNFVTAEIYHLKLEKAKGLLGRGGTAEVALELGNGVEAQNSVPAAICCFLRNLDSFREAILEAISLGGDTDTIASMTGAISGAWLGLEAIPGDWLAKLEKKDVIDVLAVKLWETAFNGN